ncbi:MAG: hypothetical protein WA709_08005 [Stellaceae bacterium]
MVEMTHSVSASHLGSEFNDFLFAPIGEDRNGMLLSALSALARLDLDPWQEAAKLAGLPGETATQRLASLIAGLPDGRSMHQDPGTIAARLVALLPRPASSNIPSRKALLGAGAVAHPRAVIYMYVILMVFVLGAQWIAASHPTPAQIDNNHTPASSTVSPQAHPPNADQ